MQNLKVKVNNNDCEIIELFTQYGCKYFNHTCTTRDYAILRNGKFFFCKKNAASIATDCQEVSIEQLHDMVVLKRNSIGDATHNTNSCGALGFLTSGNVEYFWDYAIKEWVKHGTANFKDYEMKPIQNNDLPFIDSESDVREFLDYQGGWSYKLITSSVDGCVDRDWIEVPDGACSLTTCDDTLLFWNHDETMCMNPKTESSFRRFNCGGHAEYFKMNSHTMNKLVLWRRNPQEESLNDKVVSAEGGGQKHSHYKKDVSHLEFIDVYRVLDLFEVESHAVGHAIKKLLCSGQRGAKDKAQDIQEAIDSLNRELDMMREDENNG